MAAMMTEPPRVLHEDDPGVNVEILDGLKVLSGRPPILHSHACGVLLTQLGHSLNPRNGGPGGWVLLREIEVHLDGNILIPDLAAWRRERFAQVDRYAPAMPLAPDWACEILSDSTAKIDRQRKMPLYHRYGVPHLWLVDPLLQTLEIFRATECGYLFVSAHGDQEVVHAEPFDAVELPLGEIWPTDEL